MFDKIGNLPLHPLVIHAAVVGIPLAVLLAFLFAFPRTRALGALATGHRRRRRHCRDVRGQAERSGARDRLGHQARQSGRRP